VEYPFGSTLDTQRENKLWQQPIGVILSEVISTETLFTKKFIPLLFCFVLFLSRRRRRRRKQKKEEAEGRRSKKKGLSH